jgi:pyruvate/2-oxoglutarate dehydrogenase complex dihydrolipoamide dehydrogenase (E3) component
VTEVEDDPVPLRDGPFVKGLGPDDIEQLVGSLPGLGQPSPQSCASRYPRLCREHYVIIHCMPTPYDAIIIGTGQAGPPLAIRLAKAGMKVAIVERKLFGGTCVNTGCIPTKTMVASAYAARMARRASEFGVTVGGAVTVDMKQVKARKDAVSGQSRVAVERGLRNTPNCTVYEGQARFESPREVSVGGTSLTAGKIFINVGGRATIPAMPGLDQTGYLTNSTMMDVDFLPRHLVIVGGSYIGLEFGQMFRRFGGEVTIVEMGPRLIQREDEDVSTAVKDILEQEGVSVRLNATCLSVSKRGSDVAVSLSCTSGQPEVVGSHLLLAVGRTPNTADLGLEKAGIAADPRGYITVDDELRTSVPGIWAIGDCNGRGGFTHTSYNDFEIVAANLLDHDSRRVSDRIPAYALYIDPPLGRAGMTETEAQKARKHVLVGQRPMTRVGRAVEKGETNGFMKVLVDADTKDILGAAILGTGGDEAIQSILDVMYAKGPYTVIQRAMHIHPTVSELIPTILGELKPLPPG